VRLEISGTSRTAECPVPRPHVGRFRGPIRLAAPVGRTAVGRRVSGTSSGRRTFPWPHTAGSSSRINTATGAIAQRMDFDEWGNVTLDSSRRTSPATFKTPTTSNEVEARSIHVSTQRPCSPTSGRSRRRTYEPTACRFCCGCALYRCFMPLGRFRAERWIPYDQGSEGSSTSISSLPRSAD
jgi:hypothetical protein